MHCTDDGTCELGVSTGADPVNDRIVKFHDGEWHYLLALRSEDTLSISVDDKYLGRHCVYRGGLS